MTPIEFQKIRYDLQLTQGQLAEKLGVSVRAVQQWEGGQNKIKSPIVKLLTYLQREIIVHSNGEEC